MINANSLIRLTLGGAAIFELLRRNHQRVRLGAKFIKPLLIMRLRLLVRSYAELARKNKPEEITPCASIISTPPVKPISVMINNPEMHILICTTEELAIKTFRSICRRQLSLT